MNLPAGLKSASAMSALHQTHKWDINSLTCVNCGADWWAGSNQACQSKTQSCCNKPGYDVWKYSTVQWECSACGSAKSNDPAYLSNKGSGSGFWGQSVADQLKPIGCSHEYVPYVGLKDSFEFCKKCDQKK